MEEIENLNGVFIKYYLLNHPIDNYLKQLLKSFFSDVNIPYQDLRDLILYKLREQIHKYLDSKKGEPAGQDYLFNNLALIWRQYHGNGRVTEAQRLLNDVLNIVLEWEDLNKPHRVHKGSIYYFWSHTAILQDDLDKGFFLIHSAYEEDVLTHKNENPGTPATLTVSLNDLDKNNLLYMKVKDWVAFLNNYIESYRNDRRGLLTLNDFRSKFLFAPPSKDTLFTFTFTLARLHNLARIPQSALQGNFASLYLLDVLFSLVMVIHSQIHSKISAPTEEHRKFSNLAKHLLTNASIHCGSSSIDNFLSTVNSEKDRPNNFETTVEKLLNGTFRNPDSSIPSKMACDVGLAYCIRNYSAHNVDSFPIFIRRFLEICQSIFNVLFLAVEYL